MKFRLYWRDGKTEIVKGKSISDAFNNAGYGSGALRALDYYKLLEIRKGEKNELDTKAAEEG